MNQGIHRAGRGLPITDHQVMAMSSVAHIRALIVRKESIKKSGIPSKNHLRLSRKGAGVCRLDAIRANACAFGCGSNTPFLTVRGIRAPVRVPELRDHFSAMGVLQRG